MPVVFRHKGYRFFFYSNEGEPQEPLHIHVRKGESVAKFWLEGETGIAESYGFDSQELSELLKIAIKNRKMIKR